MTSNSSETEKLANNTTNNISSNHVENDPLKNDQLTNRPLEKENIQDNENKPTDSTPAYIAGFWRRSIAYFIDVLLVGLACYIISSILGNLVYQHPLLSLFIGYALTVGYYGIFNSHINHGQSAGKMLMSIKVVNLQHQYLSVSQSLLRAAILFAPLCLMSWTYLLSPLLDTLLSMLLVCLFSTTLYLFIFNSKNRRTIHDFIIGSCVVKDQVAVSEIQPTWKVHYFIVAALSLGIFTLFIWEFTEIKTEPKPQSWQNIQYPHALSFDYASIDYQNTQNQQMNENYYSVFIDNPKLLKDPTYAADLGKYLTDLEVKSNGQNHRRKDQHPKDNLILITHYQFGLLSEIKTQSYEIYRSGNQMITKENGSSSKLSIGTGF